MGYGRRPVRDKDTGQEFSSIRKAALFYGVSIGMLTKLMRENLPLPKGLNLEYVEPIEEHELDLEEEWKPIPGYEGLYSISNKRNIRSDRFHDRYKKITHTAANQDVVVLSKHSRPKCYTVNSLYALAWEGKPINKPPFKPKGTKVRCKTDNKEFNSCIECAAYYKIDYHKLLKILNHGSGIFDGLVFERF